MNYSNITIVINTFKSESVIDNCLKSVPSGVKILVVENSNNFFFKNEVEKKYNNIQCLFNWR